MCQKRLLTTIALEAQLFHNLILFGFGDSSSVKVSALSVGIPLEFPEATLVVEPLVGKEIAARHTADWNDHRTLPGCIEIRGVKFTLAGATDYQ